MCHSTQSRHVQDGVASSEFVANEIWWSLPFVPLTVNVPSSSLTMYTSSWVYLRDLDRLSRQCMITDRGLPCRNSGTNDLYVRYWVDCSSRRDNFDRYLEGRSQQWEWLWQTESLLFFVAKSCISAACWEIQCRCWYWLLHDIYCHGMLWPIAACICECVLTTWY